MTRRRTTFLIGCLCNLLLAYCVVPVHAQNGRALPWHRSEVTDLAFSPNGSRLYSTSLQNDRVSRITAVDNSETAFGSSLGKITGTRGHAVAASPTGQWIASAGQDRTVRIWDTRSGDQIKLLRVGASKVNAVVFIPGRSSESFVLSNWTVVWSVWEDGSTEEETWLT